MQKQISQRTQNRETQRRCPPTTPTYSNHANTQGSSHSPSLTPKTTNNKKTPTYLGYSNVCASPQMSIPGQTLPNYYIKGATFERLGPLFLTPNLSMHIIKITFTHSRYHQALEIKHNKYYPWINAIQHKEWKVNPLKIIAVGVRVVVHTNIVEEFKNLHVINQKYHESHAQTNENVTTNKYPYYPHRGNSPHYPN